MAYQAAESRGCSKAWILFDFGGVIAEEGFRQGWDYIARATGHDPETLFPRMVRLILESGYVLGRMGESDFWQVVRQETGIQWSDQDLRRAILERFVLRSKMLDLVRVLTRHGAGVAMVSDQTNWLEELDEEHHFLAEFHRVFNSYRMGCHKGQASCFAHVLEELCADPSDCLFVDDSRNNVETGRSTGIDSILFQDVPSFLGELAPYCPEPVRELMP